MRRIIRWAACLLLLWAAPALAGPAEEPEAAEAKQGWVPLGEQTRAWLELQRSGAEQSPNPQGLSAPEEHRTRLRHLESYSHPIPAQFQLEGMRGEEN